MGERSGVGLVEATILDALDLVSGQPGGRRFIYEGVEYFGCERVLSVVEQRIGLAPGYAYDVLLDLALPWKVPVTLIAGCGLGARGWSGGGIHGTEARLSPAGAVALAAERGEIAPVPIGLINGSTYREGTRPPFRPEGIMGAIREIIRRPQATDEDLTDIIGPPDFLTGCEVIGDLAALAAGEPTELTLCARIAIDEENHQVVVQNIPPNVSPDEARDSVISQVSVHERNARLRRRPAGLPIEDVTDFSSRDSDRFSCIATPGTSLEQLKDQLKDVHGISTTVSVGLPQPLPDLVRRWVASHDSEDLLASMASLSDALDGLSGFVPCCHARTILSLFAGRPRGSTTTAFPTASLRRLMRRGRSPSQQLIQPAEALTAWLHKCHQDLAPVLVVFLAHPNARIRTIEEPTVTVVRSMSAVLDIAAKSPITLDSRRQARIETPDQVLPENRDHHQAN
jgi:hypothetical protein